LKIRLIRNSLIAKLLKVDGIALYPFIFCAAKRPGVKIINHELIHILQIRRDGFVCFYFNYIKEYYLFRKKGLSHNEAYLSISYEVEAYNNQTDLTYTGLWTIGLSGIS
jgi:hypothetical protein